MWAPPGARRRAALAALTSAAVAAALFGLGQWVLTDPRDHAFLGPPHGAGRRAGWRAQVCRTP